MTSLRSEYDAIAGDEGGLGLGLAARGDHVNQPGTAEQLHRGFHVVRGALRLVHQASDRRRLAVSQGGEDLLLERGAGHALSLSAKHCGQLAGSWLGVCQRCAWRSHSVTRRASGGR